MLSPRDMDPALAHKMALCAEDFEPPVSEEIVTRALAHLGNTPEGRANLRAARTELERLGASSWQFMLIFGLALLGGAYAFIACIAYFLQGRLAGGVVHVLLLTACLSGMLAVWRYGKKIWFTSTLIVFLGKLAASNPVEAAYCNALAALLEQQKTLGYEHAKRLLSDLNALLVSARNASKRANAARHAANGQAFTSHERERTELAARLSATNDDIARETWVQTLALHDERLERLRALEPLREQAEAQVAAALEAFRAVHTALVTLSLTPTTITDSVLPPALTGITETVQRLNGQARATEEAAREVALLSTGR